MKLDSNKEFPSRETVKSTLLGSVPDTKKETLVDFLIRLYSVYVDLHFAYLEINPLVCLDGVDGKEPTSCLRPFLVCVWRPAVAKGWLWSVGRRTL